VRGGREAALQVCPGINWATTASRKRNRESLKIQEREQQVFCLERTSKFPFRKKVD